MFRTIKTKLITVFDERYVVISIMAFVVATVVVTTTASSGDKDMPYQEFNKIKPLDFDGLRDPIAAMRWISDVEGCFYTCAIPTNLRFRYAQNLFRHGAKDWWNFVTKDFTPAEKHAVTW